MCSSGKYHEEEHLKKVFKLNENKYLFILSFLHIFSFVQGCSCFILVLCLFFCLCERGNVIPEQEAQWNCLCTVDLYRFSADLDILNSSSCISVSLKKNPYIFFQTELPLLAQSAPVFQWRTLSLQRVCFLLQTLLSQLTAHNPRPWTRCSEPSAAPRGTKGKGCLCSLWHLSLDFFDLQLFGAQAVRLIPKWPLSLGRTLPREHSASLRTLLWLALDPNHSAKWK